MSVASARVSTSSVCFTFRGGVVVIEHWREPKEVTAIYNELARETILGSAISSKQLGEVAKRLFELGYRKSPKLSVVK